MKSIYLISILLICKMLSPSPVFSGSYANEEEVIELKGKVRSQLTSEALVGANIYLPELKMGAVTTLDGSFNLSINPNSPNVLIQVTMVGYETRLIRLTSVELLQDLQIELKEEALQTQEVIVSAGRIASRDEIPVQVDKMSLRAMRLSGEMSSMSALQQIPGVEQIAYGTGIGKPVIRGMSFSRVLSMYQGTRYENQQWGADHGLGVNDLGIEAVEVIKGPASFLYGSGAVGGVVFMVDERPAAKGTMQAELNTTFHSNTLGLRQTATVKETTQSGFFYGVQAALENHADYQDGNQRTIGNSRFNTHTLRTNLGLQKQWGMLKLSYTFHQQNLGIIESEELNESLATSRNDRAMQLPFQNIQDHLWSLTGIFQLGRGRMETTIAHHFNKRLEIEETFDEVDLGLLQHNTTLDVKYFFDRGKVENVIGIQGFHLQNKNMDAVGKILIPDARVWDGSLYMLSTLRRKRTIYQAGIRYDMRQTVGDATAQVIRDYGYQLPSVPSDQHTFGLAHNGLSGSTGLIHEAHEKLILKTNFSSGFRAPDLAELFSNGSHPGTQRFEMGNVNMKREQNFQYDLSLTYQDRFLKMEFSPFVNYISNYIYFNPTSETVEDTDLVIWQFDQANALLYGFETQAVWNPVKSKKLELKTAFSMVRGQNPETAEYMPLMPADRLISGLMYRFANFTNAKDNYVRLTHNFVWEQNRLSDNEAIAFDQTSTPAFTVWNISGGSNFTINKQPIFLDIAVNNLLNNAYFDHLSFLRPFQINNLGRNVSVNLQIPINIKK